MKKKISKKLLSPADKRETFIGAKVTAQQKEQIKELAKDKGMTVSDYLLARALNYEPKSRLGEVEISALQNLNMLRVDILRCTSALEGASLSKRMASFNDVAFMNNWIDKVTTMVDRLNLILDQAKAPNVVPSNPKPQES